MREECVDFCLMTSLQLKQKIRKRWMDGFDFYEWKGEYIELLATCFLLIKNVNYGDFMVIAYNTITQL